MKLTRLLLAFCAISAPAATFAQMPLVVNTGNSLNCVTTNGETGFSIQSWGIGGSFGAFTGANSQISKLALSDITIIKTVDACSGQLQQKFLYGQDLPSFTLMQYATYGTATSTPILLVTLTNPIMNTYSISGGTSTSPTETISLTFTKVCIKEWKQNPDGSYAAESQICYTPSTAVVSGS